MYDFHEVHSDCRFAIENTANERSLTAVSVHSCNDNVLPIGTPELYGGSQSVVRGPLGVKPYVHGP